MGSINSLSVNNDVNDWLISSHQPRILHVFDQACNLINEHKEVLSVVTPQIGNGPFNLVLEDEILFSNHLTAKSQVFILDNQLLIGDLIINMEDAAL